MIGSLGKGIANAEAFIGCKWGDAAKLIQLMVMNKTITTPEWLRGCNQMEHLPRYTPWTPHAERAGVVLFPIPVIRQSEIAERCIWIVDYLGGPWGIGSESIFFLDEEDAFAYRMRWTF
jgi:hypothetical protein